MTAYTLTKARERARTHHLDDEGAAGTRWTDDETDDALDAAMSACLEEYVTEGGRRFSLDTGDVTLPTGTYDMSGLNPVEVHAVSYKRNDVYYPLSRQESSEVRREASTSLTVRVWYTPRFVFPASAGSPLLGSSVPEWKAFEEWVCCRAALIMATKDDERLASLERVEAQLREVVLGSLTATRSRAPSPPRTGWSRWYVWDFNPTSQTIGFSDRYTWGWL